MRLSAFISLAVLGACSACSSSGVYAPSLAPRAAEAIDPRVPIANAPPSGPADPALVSRLDALVAEARFGDAAFRTAVGEAERLAASAGDPQSESWVVAQQALSGAIAARAPVTKALGDIDAIASGELTRRGGMAPADQAAVASAAAQVGEVDRSEAAIIDRIQRRLGG
jgi:hypothetical protein